MPHKILPYASSSLVGAYTNVIDSCLDKAKELKPQASIEPALTASDFKKQLRYLEDTRIEKITENQQPHYAAIETAFRNTFYELLTSTTIDEPSFSGIWNLLDVVVIASDNEFCEPTLIIWLIEELLDSQTIEGCRTIFDYLESRRERIIAKHFKYKSLAMLRACNELLRRLSRAEDTVFCGRVFIFLFQSFPLADRSSVNLRGEFHVDNITTYDHTKPNLSTSPDHMDVDVKETDTANGITPTHNTTKPTKLDLPIVRDATPHDTKRVKPETENVEQKSSALDVDTLYPIFWSLQDYFSVPTRLFNAANLTSFKNGLEAALAKFREVQTDLETRGSGRTPEEPNKRGIKRKRGSPSEEVSSSFNPKYLTSRDLFELEISDLAFRRHVLVQALILIDFLLSLTPKAKSKVPENTKNKSVVYEYILDEDNAAWATQMRLEIANYLQQGPDGKFYYRMVDTVLLRDKNWVRWKLDSCPPFQLEAVNSEDFVEARNGAQRASANKRMRVIPMNSLDLSFLSDAETIDGLEKFKDPDRYAIPEAESLRGPMADDEFDASVAKSEEERQLAVNARASKLWRMLRICYKDKFGLLDKIDDGNNLEALFEKSRDAAESQPAADGGTANQEEPQHHVSDSLDVPSLVTSEMSLVGDTSVK
ncbi:hypothetical protein MMC13_001418 [Lambiella insularis]|nr:hypothetical protein [Lambiella insularis]